MIEARRSAAGRDGRRPAGGARGWRLILRLVLPLGLGLGLLGAPRLAGAEPRFSLRSGLSCARCHTSPSGGGKRTAYGALYAHSELTLLDAGPRALPRERGGQGGVGLVGLATGEVTSWLALGADLRLSNLTTLGDETQNSFDASGANLYLELRPWPGRVTLYLDEQVGAGGAQNRSAWGMIHGPYGLYLRGGRFFPPFGWRLLDDEALTRRATGARFTNPDLGLELGLDRGPWLVTLALTNGSFAAADTDALKALWGQIAYTLGQGQLGLSAAYNPSEAGCRTLAGLHGGWRYGRLSLLGEADLIVDRPATSARRSYQLAALAALELQLLKGLSLRASWDYHDADLELTRDRRQRLRVGLDLFPLRMVEVKLYYINYQAETQPPLDRADRLEAVLHVYL